MKRKELSKRPARVSNPGGRWLLVIAAVAALQAPALPRAQAAQQRDFASAGEAVDALVAALRADDSTATLEVLGPDGERLIHSGDPVADREGRERLVRAYDQKHRIELQGESSAYLVVAAEQWSLPIPIVRRGGRWHFDTAASAQKIIDRRVGRNELSVIEVCRAYVEAQREYASVDRMGDGLHEYAQKFNSSPGKRDGLFWETADGEKRSPMGPLVVSARAEGYDANGEAARPAPYHGYVYRILTRQGPHAAGGARNYIVDGRMTRGFALLAFPARWGDSGIMTFMVNQNGIVFQKNLGPDTPQIARAIREFDPDASWTTP